MDFETLKSSSSNFDKLTKALEQNLAPEDQSNKKETEFMENSSESSNSTCVLIEYFFSTKFCCWIVLSIL